MFQSFSNAGNRFSDGSARSAVIWISTVVAVASSALYLALSDVSATKYRRLATPVGVGASTGQDAANPEVLVHPEPFGIDQSVLNK